MIDTATILAMTPAERRALVLKTARSECSKFRANGYDRNSEGSGGKGHPMTEERKAEIVRQVVEAVEASPGIFRRGIGFSVPAGHVSIDKALKTAEARGLVRYELVGKKSRKYYPGPAVVLVQRKGAASSVAVQ